MPRCAACWHPLACYPPLVDRAQLVRAGHEVRLYIAPDYLSLVPMVAGLSVIGSQQTTAAMAEKLAPYIATGDAAAMMQALFEATVEYFAREADALKAACAGWAEIVIFNGVAAHVAFAVTEAQRPNPNPNPNPSQNPNKTTRTYKTRQYQPKPCKTTKTHQNQKTPTPTQTPPRTRQTHKHQPKPANDEK